MRPSPRTSAKSRIRRNRRLAMRGVPRARRPISSAPASSIGMPSSRAERRTIAVSSVGRVELERLDGCRSAISSGDPELAGPRRRAHQREAFDRQGDGARARARAGHQLDAKVLHRRIQALLDDRLQAVDLVDEQHVAAAQRGQDARPGRPCAPAPAPTSPAPRSPSRAPAGTRASSCPGPAGPTAARGPARRRACAPPAT